MKASIQDIQRLTQDREVELKELEVQEASLQSKRESLQSQITQVENLNRQVEQYVFILLLVLYIDIFRRMGSQNLQEKYQQTTEARNKVETTIGQTDSDLKKCTEALNAMKEKLAQRNMTKRTITDNLRYREGLSEILAMEDEIKKREKHIHATLPQVPGWYF